MTRENKVNIQMLLLRADFETNVSTTFCGGFIPFA